jgi:hypothetical protein
LTKRWDVEYYAFDVQKNELIRRIVYQPAELKTEKERRKWEMSATKEIDTLFNQRYVIDYQKVKSEMIIIDAIKKYIRDCGTALGLVKESF